MTPDEIVAYLDSEIQRIEDMRQRFAAAKHPMGLSSGQRVELSVLRTVRSKIVHP